MCIQSAINTNEANLNVYWFAPIKADVDGAQNGSRLHEAEVLEEGPVVISRGGETEKGLNNPLGLMFQKHD